MKNILCFGDSNTYGYDAVNDGHFEYEDRWCGGILQNSLGDGYKVYEAGFGGRTTVFEDPLWDNACGLKALPIALGSYMPLDMVVIMLGTNDCKIHLNQPVYSIVSGMGRLIYTVRNYPYVHGGSAPQILIVSPVAIVRDGSIENPSVDFDEAGALKSVELKEAFRKLALDCGCGFLAASDHAEPCSFDGVHLDKEGHRRLGEAVAEAVKAMLT